MNKWFGILFAFAALTIPSMAWAQEHTVTRVGMVAKPRAYQGACPVDIEFIGTIFVSRHPVWIEYRWERSDGAVQQPRRIQITSAGQGVAEWWKLSGRAGVVHQVWMKLHVLAPTGISGVSPTVTVNCL